MFIVHGLKKLTLILSIFIKSYTSCKIYFTGGIFLNILQLFNPICTINMFIKTFPRKSLYCSLQKVIKGYEPVCP
jgi:hypothetical protein